MYPRSVRDPVGEIVHVSSMFAVTSRDSSRGISPSLQDRTSSRYVVRAVQSRLFTVTQKASELTLNRIWLCRGCCNGAETRAKMPRLDQWEHFSCGEKRCFEVSRGSNGEVCAHAFLNYVQISCYSFATKFTVEYVGRNREYEGIISENEKLSVWNKSEEQIVRELMHI